ARSKASPASTIRTKSHSIPSCVSARRDACPRTTRAKSSSTSSAKASCWRPETSATFRISPGRFMTAQRPEIAAIVVCFNEEDNIGRCLASLSWCDEIVVVDAFSTDRTVEIARRHTDRVIQRRWKGYRDQKSFAHSQASKEWVFLVDSDEEVSPELK